MVYTVSVKYMSVIFWQEGDDIAQYISRFPPKLDHSFRAGF